MDVKAKMSPPTTVLQVATRALKVSFIFVLFGILPISPKKNYISEARIDKPMNISTKSNVPLVSDNLVYFILCILFIN